MNGAYMKQLLSFLATQMGICITQHKADCCNALNSGLDSSIRGPRYLRRSCSCRSHFDRLSRVSSCTCTYGNGRGRAWRTYDVVLRTERIDPRLVLVRLEALDGNLHARQRHLCSGTRRELFTCLMCMATHTPTSVMAQKARSCRSPFTRSAGRPVNDMRACRPLQAFGRTRRTPYPQG